MEIELILSLIGIIATIIIGYLGVKLTKKQKSKTQLMFFENSCFSLFKKVVKELDDIEIKYKQKVIDENLLLFKGTIFNSGNNDIDKQMIHKPLSILLPNNFIWAKVKVLDSSEDITVTENVENNELILNWDILKSNEYITFDSIIEFKPESDAMDSDEFDIAEELMSNIKFNQRITNLNEVINEEIPKKPDKSANIFVFSLLLLFIGLSLFLSLGQFFYPNSELHYKLKKDSTLLNVKIKKVHESYVEFINTDDETKFSLSNDELNFIFSGRAKIVQKDISYSSLVVGGIFFIIVCFSGIMLFSHKRRDYILYKRVKNIFDKINE